MAAKAYTGACHCGKVRFEATADLDHVVACNCSICQKHGLMLTFTSDAQFKLVSGEEQLGDYQFNKKVIHHRFCRTCGVEPCARGIRPDGAYMVAINVRCLDGVDVSTLSPKPFDGRKL